jgi:hypothetical protein
MSSATLVTTLVPALSKDASNLFQWEKSMLLYAKSNSFVKILLHEWVEP